MAAGYAFDLTDNKTTLTHTGEDDNTLGIWGFTGQVQLRAVALTDTNAEYRISQAGVQDVVIPYNEITQFGGSAAPTNDPEADFDKFLASFPSFNPAP